MGPDHEDEEMTIHRSLSFSSWISPQRSPCSSGGTNEADQLCCEETLESFEDDAASVESPTKKRRFSAWTNPWRKSEEPQAESANLAQKVNGPQAQQQRGPRGPYRDFGFRPAQVTLAILPLRGC